MAALEKRRIVVCYGPGGVGKTTLSAALALRLALSGKRVLCLGIDPSKRLADALGVDPSALVPQEVDIRALHSQNTGSLHVMLLDVRSVFDDLVRRHVHRPGQAERILRNPLYQHISRSLSGTQEYMALEQMLRLSEQKEWDKIVIDTPPTIHAKDLIDAPRRLLGGLDAPLVRWLGTAISPVRHLMRFGSRLALRGMRAVTGETFVNDVVELLTEMAVLFGTLRQRAEKAFALLQQQTTGGVLVMIGESKIIEESFDFAAYVKKRGLHIDGLVVNQLRSLLAAELCRDPSLAQNIPGVSENLKSALERLLSDFCARVANEHQALDQLRRGTEEALWLLPRLNTQSLDLPALASLLDFIQPGRLEA